MMDRLMVRQTDMGKLTDAALKFCCKCAKNQASSSVQILVCPYCFNVVVAVVAVDDDDDDDSNDLMVNRSR
jgi:hypothetical protein